MREHELIVIGGGSAGLAAAIGAYENGLKDILIIEREGELGGILLQCIHNGFGLHAFGEELAGPTYAERWIYKLVGTSIQVKLDTSVISITKDHTVSYSNKEEGYVKAKGKAIVLAMGCRERPRGAIAIPGYRPAGVLTAGTAQEYVNIKGYNIGKKVFILGSGDIGLIMARRLTLEGAKVVGVAEIMPYSNGLPRNVKQCLDDYDIPLYLSHTITFIDGHDRISSVTISKVDENLKLIPNTEKTFEVDTLLLSVGLIPENDLSEIAGIELSSATKGAIVSNELETSVPGIFSCGNVLHVHDLVDYVSKEGENAGKSAADFVLGRTNSETELIDVTCSNDFGYILPSKIKLSGDSPVEFMYRIKKPMRDVTIGIYSGDTLIRKITKKTLIPSIMEKVSIQKSKLGSNDIIIKLIKEEII
ncbi:MAG: FAD-dependent oxidoreductase [Peptostreptococcaceae bacterium]|nr:FAD-dependent oxidoreductase [Peptostreptococcaceae bacterium]